MYGERLLTTRQVAMLFNRSAHWWHKTGRAQLEARGFPPPVLGGNYDPRAVDAWLLLQMPPELRAANEEARAAESDADERARRAAMKERMRANMQRVIAGLDKRRRARAS